MYGDMNDHPLKRFGSLTGIVIPSNNVQGFGKLRGRPIVFTADDYSIRAGHADGSLAAKTVHIFA
jgi:hypothetical protein